MVRNIRSSKLSPYLPVVINNDLIRAKYSMDLSERRMLYVAMSKINPEDQQFNIISFTVSEYFELIEKSMENEKISRGGKQYDIIKDGCRSLLRRLVEIQEGANWRVFQWCSRAEFNEDTSMISLKFHDDMKDYLLFMLENRGFTKFLLKYALPLSSTYAQRFYEMFRGLVYPGAGVSYMRVDIADLKERLDLTDRYPAYKDFRKRVLQTAESEINAKTDICISFKEIRHKTRGRPIEAINVTIQLKESMTHEWDRYLLWDKQDLLEKLRGMISKEIGQIIVVEDLENYQHQAVARLVYEISAGTVNLREVRNAKGFVAFMLNKYSDPTGIREQMLTAPEPAGK